MPIPLRQVIKKVMLALLGSSCPLCSPLYWKTRHLLPCLVALRAPVLVVSYTRLWWSSNYLSVSLSLLLIWKVL